MRYRITAAASVIFSLLALPTSVMDRWATTGLLAVAITSGVMAFKGGRRRAARVGLSLGVIGVLTVAVGFIEFHRPVQHAAPDETPYHRAGAERTVPLPLTVATTPITRLALVEFAPEADAIYKGFEPQLIEQDSRQGWRVLGYRHDNRVDVYDELGMDRRGADDFSVIGDGLSEHVEVPMGVTGIERDVQGRARIQMHFTDVEGREVAIDIHEGASRRSTPTNLLAPVGASSQHPTSLPVFVLHDFEFVRMSGTTFDITIDGRRLGPATFPMPFPMQGQNRSFIKYTPHSEIMEVFPSTDTELRHARTEPGTDRFTEDDVQYLFAGDALERILVGQTEIVFDPALDLTTTHDGRVTITPPPGFGEMSGPYRVVADGPRATIDLGIEDVEVPRQRDLAYRAIVNRWSFFGTWPKAYRYHADIDTDRSTITAEWSNTAPLE